MSRRRLDQELLRRDLAASRSQARELIEAGKVLVSGAVADKPARLVDPGDPVLVTVDGPRFVSRGGEKLDAAQSASLCITTGAASDSEATQSERRARSVSANRQTASAAAELAAKQSLALCTTGGWCLLARPAATAARSC